MTTENATTLGLAVHGYLTRPVLGPDLSAAIPLETRIDTLLAEIEHLQAVGLVSETQRQAIVDAAQSGSIPEPVNDPHDAHPTGTVLIATGRRYQPYFSAAYDMVAALSAVTTAAIAGFAHSGPEAALVCASVASVRAIADGHKREQMPTTAAADLAGHKQSPGHKQEVPPPPVA